MNFSFSVNLNTTPTNLGNLLAVYYSNAFSEQRSIIFPYFTCFKLYKYTSIVSMGQIFVEKLIFEHFVSGQFRSHRNGSRSVEL